MRYLPFIGGLILGIGFGAGILAQAQEPVLSGAEATAWSYRYQGQLVPLEIDETRAAILLFPTEGERDVLGELLSSEPVFRALEETDRQAYRHLWFPRFSRAATEAERLAALERLHAQDAIELATVLLRHGNARLVPRPELLVTVDDPGADPREQFALHGLEVIREFPGRGRIFHVSVHGPPRAAFSRAAALIETLTAEFEVGVTAEPNFILLLEPHAPPNDPRFDAQWSHRNTGQTGGTLGADLSSITAWEAGTGDPSVVIAILDEGVDVHHEDLAPHIVPGYDATHLPPPAGIPGNAASSDGHGTACAGIAAAVGNNGVGITGVCWRGSILPVRLGYGSHWSENVWLVDALTWAADSGADVLSCSWGGGPPSEAVRAAIQYANSTGRGGLGCPIVFSTGNGNTAVAFPAKVPETIAVGATSPCDERKQLTSCDGENWWGSNFGPEVDIVAPGALISTTDNSSAAGFVAGDYLDSFTGTSAACPHVAGAAALLLSLRPELTADEVRSFLENSADDEVGLPSEDTPGWDPYMGWGRLNLAKLVAFATALSPVVDLQCAVDRDRTELSWKNGESYESVIVARDGAVIVTLPGDSSTTTDVPSVGAHTYRVHGVLGPEASFAVQCEVFFTGGATELVWAPPDASGSIDGGAALTDALIANSRLAVQIDDLYRVQDLNVFDHVWVNLGVWPNNTILTSGESDLLRAYLTDGKGGAGLYLEGGDAWVFNPQLPVHDLFLIDGLDDGWDDLDVVIGWDAGLCNLAGLDLSYGGENAWIDRLAPLPGAQTIQTNNSPTYDTGIFRDAGDFRTIGTSVEFGGFTEVGSRVDLMAAYLDCLLDRVDPAEVFFMRGDANPNGLLTVTDAIATLGHLFLGTPLLCEDAADFTDDGAIQLGDVLSNLHYQFTGGPAPPPPFPGPGVDPTDDDLGCEVGL